MVYKRIQESLDFKWENEFASNCGNDSLPNAFGSEKKPGSLALGLFVQALSESPYQGKTTYEENAVDDFGSEPKPGSSNQCGPTPAPTKEQCEKYGILHSHCDLDNAVNAANNGDRIYLSPGVHTWAQDWNGPGTPITKEIDIIGLGGPDDVIIEIDYSTEKECFLIDSKTFGFFNLTFKVTYDREQSKVKQIDRRTRTPNAAYGSGNRAIVTFKHTGDGATHIIKYCIFEMGISVLK